MAVSVEQSNTEPRCSHLRHVSLPLSDDLCALGVIRVSRAPAMTQVVVAVAGAGADVTRQACKRQFKMTCYNCVTLQHVGRGHVVHCRCSTVACLLSSTVRIACYNKLYNMRSAVT
jgi:hypothetical protein